jgi:hypothetical protein
MNRLNSQLGRVNMLTFKYRFLSIKFICFLVLLTVFNLSLIGCSDRIETPLSIPEQPSISINAGKLLEVAPVATIQKLRQSLDRYQPQVSILNPQAEQLFEDTAVPVQLQVRDLPIFKDDELQMGPHLKLILDNEPAQEVYNIDEPVILENLTPGTHTIRVFASRPWHESFKNEGAYAQTTFHVLTKTGTNKPDPSLPLLTYSYPQGEYGAEPILLDFYLTNAPLHLAAAENSALADWRIRVTINGQSFVLDSWQPVYLTGFEKGKNWIQLEFLDGNGDRVDNAFNTTVRLLSYNPKIQDTLSKLMKGDLSLEYARSIIDPTYNAKLVPTTSPTPTVEPEVTPEPTPTVEPEVTPEPSVSVPEETPNPELEVSAPEITPTPEPTVSVPEETPTVEPSNLTSAEKSSESKIDLPAQPLVEPTVTPESQEEIPNTVELAPTIQPEASPSPNLSVPQEKPVIVEPSISAEPSVSPTIETPAANKQPIEKPQWRDRILNRIQQLKTSFSI